MWLNIRRAPVTGEHSKSGSKFDLISVNKSKSVTSNQSFSWKKNCSISCICKESFKKELFLSNALAIGICFECENK